MDASIFNHDGWAAAARADERYRQLVELAPDSILVHDGGQIVLANASAIRLAGGTSRGQVVGKPIDTFLDPPYLKSVQAQLTDAINPAEPAPPVRDTFYRLDGSEVPVEVRAVAFLDHGRPAAHLVIRDIRDRLEEEESSRQLIERLHEADRMESVGALAGGVAHEVNNMMQVVLGFSDFLLRDEGLPEACKDDVLEIIRGAEHAASVTRQLLAFSRRALRRPAVVDLTTLMKSLEPMIRLLLGEERLLTTAMPEILKVWVDPRQLEQAIINLVLNARDAMPAGGTVTISGYEIRVLPDLVAADGLTVPAGDYAAIAVRDTGIGMNAETLAQIFEPFFTTKAIGHGTGLGLPAVQGVLVQNKGYVTVSSASGQGTTITLYLALLPEATVVTASDTGVRTGAGPSHRGSTVLIVEDEPGVRAITTRILELEGFQVVQVADGATALELAGRMAQPDLLLTDLMMPGIGGAEMVRQLELRWPTLRVLFMSGYSTDELVRQGAISATRALIQKPFSRGELVTAVAELLS